MGIKREKWLKQCLKRVYFIFPITSAISAPLKSVFNSCLVGLEPLAHKTVDPNRLKHSFALNSSAFQRNQIAWAACGLTRSLSLLCPVGGTPGNLSGECGTFPDSLTYNFAPKMWFFLLQI